MKRSVAMTVATLLAAGVFSSGSCLAGGGGPSPASPGAVLGALAGSVVAPAELGAQRARGIAINVNGSGAVAAGTSSNNAVLGSPITGFITNDHSIDNNAGITSVLQNFGNNSVMQVSTTINISVH
jgi:hypothetical protein